MEIYKTPIVSPEDIEKSMDGEVSAWTVRRLCREGLFPGAQRIGEGKRCTWTIPYFEAAQFVEHYDRYSRTPLVIEPAPVPRFEKGEE